MPVAHKFIQVPPDSTGKKVDQAELTIGAHTVNRQVVCLGDPETGDAITTMKNAPPAGTDYGLVTREAPTGMQESVINITTATDTTVIAGAAGGRKIWKLVLWANGDQTVTIKTGSTIVLGPLDMAQGGTLQLQKDSDPWFTCAASEAFVITTDSTGAIRGRVYYT